MRFVFSLVTLLVHALILPVHAAEAVEEIVNYRSYSPLFASAGQPTAEQLSAVQQAGFERVIYVAYSDQENALPSEDRVVKNLGMEYIHVPVEWNAPTVSDFRLFAAAMRADAGKKTLLHCQVNYRASAFSFLYRVIYEDVSIGDAKVDMDSVWEPNDTWRQLIFDVLGEHGIAADCATCNWGNEQ